MSLWRTLRRRKRTPFKIQYNEADDLTFDESPFYVRNDTILNMVKRISQLNEKSIHGCVFNIKQSGLLPPQIAQLLTKHYHNYLCLKYQGELLNELPQYFSNVLKIFDRLRTAKNNALNIEYQRIVNGVSNVQPRQIHCIHDDDLQGHLFQPSLIFMYKKPPTNWEI